jgi:hypothetical protein
VEVRPRYVVVDTNCLIENLGVVKVLVRARLFQVVLPTTVGDELRQLALGTPVPRAVTMLSRDQWMTGSKKMVKLMAAAKTCVAFLKVFGIILLYKIHNK